MKKTLPLLLILFVISPSVLAGAPTAAGTTVPVKANWTLRMQELYKTLAELLTDVSSEKRFNARENQKRIQKNARRLSELAHDLGSTKLPSPDRDPSVQILGSLFAEESERAYRLLRSGKPHQKAYARELLQGLPGYCIACHTRAQTGPSFHDLPLNPSISQLRTVEQGRFYAATRQFDRALEEFSKGISEPGAASQRFAEWQESVRNSLAIAVRVKQDPALALGIVEKVLNATDMPYFLRQDVLSWKLSILDWQKEPSRGLTTEEGLHAEAVRLLAKAHELQKYPADHGADVLYLRASAAVHQLLQLGADARYTHEAYLMAGLCYDVLRSFHLGELHEIYFESCIRSSPHTSLAETCYQRYEQSIYDGFTGSGGTDIPADLDLKLKTLESLAHPVPTEKSRQP